MQNTNTLEALEARLKEIDEEGEAIRKLIAIWKGQPISESTPTRAKILSNTFSVRGRAVNAVIELIHKNGRQVTNDEILNFIEEKGISLGDTKDKQASLAAILSQETAKKSARLRRVARGVYDLK